MLGVVRGEKWQRCFWLDARRNPGKRLPGETVKSQSVKVLRRRLGKAFSETNVAVDSAPEQMNWQDFVRVPCSLALYRQDQNEHWATTCALSCNSSNWLH